jgi:hypothetical protein
MSSSHSRSSDMSRIIRRVANLNEVEAHITNRPDGSIRCGDVTAVLDLTSGTRRFLAHAINEREAMVLREAFTWHDGDDNNPPRIEVNPDRIVDSPELFAAFRSMQVNIEQGRHLSSSSLSKVGRILSLAVTNTLTFGPFWVGVGRTVESIGQAYGLNNTENFWLRNVISAGTFAVANQFLHPVSDILEILMGGQVRPGHRRDAGIWLKMLSVVASQESGAVVMLGVVLGGVAALPQASSNALTVLQDHLRFFPAFASWAVYQIVVERYVTRRPQYIRLPSRRESDRRFGSSVKAAMREAWNEALGGPNFKRNLVQLIAKYLATLSLPPTVNSLATLITGSNNIADGSALERFNSLFAINAAFVGEFFVVAQRLLALIYLIREHGIGNLQLDFGELDFAD